MKRIICFLSIVQIIFYTSSCSKTDDPNLIGYWKLDSISNNQGLSFEHNTTLPIKEVTLYFKEDKYVTFGLYGGQYSISGNNLMCYVKRSDESLIPDSYWTKKAVECLNKSENYKIENNILTITTKDIKIFKLSKL